MPYAVIEHSDYRAFHSLVIDHLLQDEAANCLQIGLVEGMARGGYSPTSTDELEQPLLWTVDSNSRLDVVAIQTRKKEMIVTRGSSLAMECIAERLAAICWSGSALIGFPPSIEVLVRSYERLSSRSASLSLNLRAFQVDRVTAPRPATGRMRMCDRADREWLAHFMQAFDSAIGESSGTDTLARADRRIELQQMFCWEDPMPVAIAGWAGKTPHGIRVNSAYTPVEFRGRGYASNLVAGLSRLLLEQRNQFCFLFADQGNPTSNRIYQQIGYRAVGDSQRWDFTA